MGKRNRGIVNLGSHNYHCSISSLGVYDPNEPKIIPLTPEEEKLIRWLDREVDKAEAEECRKKIRLLDLFTGGNDE